MLRRTWLALLLAVSLAPLAGCAATAEIEDEDPVEDDGELGREAEALTVNSTEWAFFDRLNSARRARGLNALRMQPGLVSIARSWSRNMDERNRLYHRTNLRDRVNAVVTRNWTAIGENVGTGGDVAQLHAAFMNSPAHRANILGAYNYVGIGVSKSDGKTIWVTVNFLKSPARLNTVPR